ncbi:MAG: 30S ribosomal protein S17 [Candidatus Saganbacteria bacterium]|nr:30S ribosomal protein S17 [Candidatus Saganbacteria bacterium]
MSDKRGNAKRRKGIVVSDKMDKTVVVQVERVFSHPVFGKTVKSYKRFKAHDQENKCKTGDQVQIEETRPLSKDKRWRVIEIIGFKKVTEKDRPGPLHKEAQEEEKTVGQVIDQPETKKE